MKLTNTFVGGKMNMDIDERLIPKNQYVYAYNIEVTNPDDTSDAGVLRNCVGNMVPVNKFGYNLDIKDTYGNALDGARCIGAVAVNEINALFAIITSVNEDLIIKYTDYPDIPNPNNGVYGVVGNLQYILRAPKTGASYLSTRQLNLDSTFLVTGINYLNGFLMWTDNLNPPRLINTTSFLQYDGLKILPAAGSTTTPVPWMEEDINVIVKPPVSPPVLTLSNDGTDKNYMKDKFLYFSYRYKYQDGQWSSMAPFSSVAFYPASFSYSQASGNSGMENINNHVNITVKTGSRRVMDIQLLFKDSQFENIYIIDTINKKKPIVGLSANPTIDNDTTWTYPSFDNSKIYASLPSNQLTRLFDNVPVKSVAQDIIGSRLIYGNYTQYFDMYNVWGSPVIPNYTCSPYNEQFAASGQVRASWKTNRDYEIAISYLDDYGRMCTPITSKTNTCHIAASDAGKKNGIYVEIKHYPPKWAKKYRLFVKQSRDKYYNLFPLSIENSTQETASYYRINSSDKDKVNAGDTVLLKSNYAGPTHSGSEYQVLDVGYKEAGAINGTNLSGIYFKLGYIESNTTLLSNTFTGSPLSDQILNANDVHWKSSFSTDCIYSNIVVYKNNQNPYEAPITDISYSYISQPTNDMRYIIEYAGVDSSGNHLLKYKLFNTTGGYISGMSPNYTVPFKTSSGSSIAVPIVKNYLGTTIGTLNIASSVYFSTGDTFRLNVYSKTSNVKSIFGNTQNKLGIVLDSDQIDPIIYAGSNIEIGNMFDGYATSSAGTNIYTQTQSQFFTSPSQFPNIQEWFWESGAYSTFLQNGPYGALLGNKNVVFRRGTASIQTIAGVGQVNVLTTTGIGSGNIYMIVFSTMPSLPTIGLANTFSIGWTGQTFSYRINTQKNIFCAEVTPQSDAVSVFHECSEELSILTDNGKLFHGGFNVTTAKDQTLSTPAKILLYPGASTTFTENMSFNCFAYDNGVESNRIRDAFNKPTMQWSPRVMVPTDDYAEQNVYAGLTYSGVYKEDSNINHLNEFNVSTANFKYLDKSFGTIQKIKSRDTNLLVLQSDKVSKILFGKNLLSDSAGGGQIASIPEVLGTQVSYEGEFGISQNPESFAFWGNSIYFTDSKRGAVMRLDNNGLFEISNYGMKSFFSEKMKLFPDTEKQGVFDPYYKRYIVSETERFKNVNNTVVVVNNPNDVPAGAYSNPGYATVTLPSA